MLNVRIGDHSIKWLDDRNYVLLRHGVSEKDGKATDVRCGYYNQLDGAVHAVAKIEADHASGLSAWLDDYRNARAEWVSKVDADACRYDAELLDYSVKGNERPF